MINAGMVFALREHRPGDKRRGFWAFKESRIMGFEFFEEDGRSFAPRASIRKNGQIGFNQGAIKRFNIENDELVAIGYDRENRAIAIKRLAQAQKGAKKITVRENNAWISAKGFLDFFGINYDAGKAFSLSQEGELLVFYLGDEAPPEDGP
jgi:hypothetical protein